MSRSLARLARRSVETAFLPARLTADLLAADGHDPAGDGAADPEADGGPLGAAEWMTEARAEVESIVGAVATALTSPVSGALDNAGELVDDVGEWVEEHAAPIGELVEDASDLIEDGFGVHRRVWSDADADHDDVEHAQIEVRGIEAPTARGLRQRLRRALEQVDGVHWAEVNAITGRVAVAFDATSPVSGIISVVEGVEDAYGVRRERLDEAAPTVAWDDPERAEHPADVEPVHRAVVALAGGGLGLGYALVGRALRLPRVPVELAAVASIVEHNPWLRQRARRLLGRRGSELALPLAGSAGAAAAQGPLGILVDLAHQGLRLTELRARHEVWNQREPEFYAQSSGASIEPPDLAPRPVPLPAGPVERASQGISVASLAGFAVTLAATRRPGLAADAFLAGLPKPARLGREGFACQLGRTLAARGVVPLDGTALRHLDRVDTVVIDSDALMTGDGDGDELDAGAELVAGAVREAGHRLVIAGDRGDAATRLDADAHIPRGKAMGAAIRRLQADGAVVMVVSRRGKTGQAAADVGVGLTRESGRPPWGSDLICGRELVDAVTLVHATTAAAAASRRAAWFAGAGSSLGALLALSGPRLGAGRRCLAVVNGAAGAALASGTWAAVELARRPVPRPDRPVAWHERSPAEVLEALATRAEGLSEATARHRRHLQRSGAAEIGAAEPFLAELANPLNPVLGVGAALSAAIGSTLDAGLVLGLIGVNTAVGGVQRLRADRAVAALLERTSQPVRVVRDGAERSVSEDELVVGDVIRLSAGEAVPGDCRVLDADGLEVDESSLTGESLPVAKHAEATPGAPVAARASMLYEDASVAAGSATAVVVALHGDTELARAADGVPAGGESGVERRLAELTRRILPGVGAAAGAVALAGLLRRWPLQEVAATGVSLAVAAVPEGLPLLASAGQLAGARRLAARGAVVRNPRAVEALGRVDVLCVDKTGTLTEGVMRLRAVSDGETVAEVEELGDDHRTVLAAAVRATHDAEGMSGDHTEQALLAGAAAADVAAGDGDDGMDGWQPVTELPFEASRGLSAVLGRAGGAHRLVAKGAPEAVLELSVRQRRPGGEPVALDDAGRRALADHADALAGRGYRVLAVAARDASARTGLDVDRVGELDFLGFVALADPVRPAAAAALTGIAEAGVRPVLLTGDHPDTARAVAAEVGLADSGTVVAGAELADLDDDALAARVDEAAVFARVTPAQKVRVVEALRRRGGVVAMTGDGANDAAAIRTADVGVALGRRATGAARNAADVVVLDDRVETLIDALVEGRALWGSVREALGVLVGGNLGEIGFTVATSLVSRGAPMAARQFMLVNLFTDLAPALAIAVRRPHDTTPQRLLREGPEVSLGAALQRDIAVRAVATGAAATGAWLLARPTGTRAHASTVAMVALVGAQLGQTVAAGGVRQPLVLAAGAGSAAALAGVVQTPGISGFFGCRPLGPLGWSQAVGAAAAATAGAQAAQWWLDRRARPCVG